MAASVSFCLQEHLNDTHEQYTHPSSLAWAAIAIARVRNREVSVESASEYSYPNFATRGLSNDFQSTKSASVPVDHDRERNIPGGMR